MNPSRGTGAFDSRRGDEAIRRLRDEAVPHEGEPSAAARFSGPIIRAMRQRNVVTGLVIPIIAAISVGIAAVVLVGANSGNGSGSGGSAGSTLTDGFPPARSAAADFTDTAALAGRGVSQSLSQVATYGTTAVAVGAQSGTRIAHPRFFYSADSGRTWQLATVGGDPLPGQSASLVAGGPRGWLALDGGFTFFSPNARSWLPSATLPLQAGDRVTTVTATSAGFLAGGENVPAAGAGQATPVVWLWANGSDWQRIAGPRLGLTSGASHALGITHAASNGNAVVITAAVAGGGSGTWRSADGGTTWSPVTIPAATGQSATLSGLAPLRNGFVAVRPANGATEAAVYISADGTTWKQSATLATANGAPLTTGLVSGGAAGAVVTGQATGLEFAFISADGTNWTGTDPIGNAGAERVSGVALTSGGQAVFAGTSGGSATSAGGATSAGSATSAGGGAQQPMLTLVGVHGAATQVNMRSIEGAAIPQVAVNAIAADGATEAAAGSADGLPSLWTSPDGGSTWTRGTGTSQAVFNRAGDSQLTSVAHGAAGWLAVGGATTGTGTGAVTGAPVVVGSAGGQSWTAADGEAAFRGAGLVTTAAAAGTSGYVVVGRQVTGGRTVATAWYAPGLTGWQRAASAQPGALDGAGKRQMNAVAATGHGFVAAGSDGTQPMAWLSASGKTWSAVTLPLPGGAASAALSSVAVNGDTVAAVGTESTANGQRLPYAAVSANGGMTWSEASLPLPKGGPGSVTALTAAGGGFTATGTEGPSGAQDVVVWLFAKGTSPSGTWTATAPTGAGLAGPGTQAITALTGAGVTLTGVGFAATAATEEPTIWQSPVRS